MKGRIRDDEPEKSFSALIKKKCVITNAKLSSFPSTFIHKTECKKIFPFSISEE